MSIGRRILNLFRRRSLEHEIDAELAAHLDMRTEDNLADGMSAAEAWRNARVRFGSPTVTREHTLAADAALTLENLWTDVRYATRQLHRSPGFAATVVLTLALGIGANLAVFQLVYGVLLAQLPIQHPEQLYALHTVESPFDHQHFVSYPAWQRLRKASSSATPLIARSGLNEGVLQTSDKLSSRARYQLVSDNFFSVLGVFPTAGRLFVSSDGQPGQSEWPAVLRYAYARQHFGPGRAAIGAHAVINGVPIVVVGVSAERFSGVMAGFAPDLWLPLEAQATDNLGTWFDSFGPGYDIHLDQPWEKQSGIFWLWLLARAPSGKGAAAAARWTAALQPELAQIAAATKDPHTRASIQHAQVQLISASAGEGLFRERFSRPLLLLMAMTAAIFLVGCLNLANLQVARLSTRQRELAIRISLGASRWRLLRQVLIEDLILAAIGGLIALAAAQSASALLLRWASPRDWLMQVDLRPGAPLFLLGAGLLLGSLFAFSVIPAWRLMQSEFAAASGSKRLEAGSNHSHGARSWSSVMLAGQVSLSLLLVGMAVCFAESLLHLARIDAGMDRDHVLSVHLDMNDTGYSLRQPNLPALYAALVERLEALPAVRAAGVEMCELPGCGWNTAFYAFGLPQINAQAHGEEDHVGPGYFRAMGIAFLRGRDFSRADTKDTPLVAIVNHAYARNLFGDQDPVGHWIGYEPAPHDHSFLIVGEVGDALVDGLREPAPPVAYLSIDQNPAAIHSIEVSVHGLPASASADVRQALRAFDANLPVTEIVAMDTELDDGLTTQKLLARLTGVLAALTLGLASLGFYGLLSYRVARRRFEIGIRMAMGATRANVYGMILGQTLLILLAGIVPGLLLTLMMSRAAKSLLYGSADANLVAFACATMALVVIGFLAALVPARRAASLDPMETLRAQ